MSFQLKDRHGFLRNVAVLAHPAWLDERAARGGPLPIVVVLHDELATATAEDMALRFRPVVYGDASPAIVMVPEC